MSNEDCPDGRVCNIGQDDTVGTCCLSQKRGMYHFPFINFTSKPPQTLSISTIYSKLAVAKGLICVFKGWYVSTQLINGKKDGARDIEL